MTASKILNDLNDLMTLMTTLDHTRFVFPCIVLTPFEP